MVAISNLDQAVNGRNSPATSPGKPLALDWPKPKRESRSQYRAGASDRTSLLAPTLLDLGSTSATLIRP